MKSLSENVFRKFIDIISIKNWQVLSNNGWNDIAAINKTIKYDEWSISFSDGAVLNCADNHILVDIYGQEVFARDCRHYTFANSKKKIVYVTDINPTEERIHMYDLTLSDNSNHLYYTNGILSHNTTTYCMFLLWYLIFNPEKKVLIAANKKSTSLEILGKIQLAYEMLPNWIKPGLVEFNKSKMKFGNLSEIVAEATSSDSARSTSCSILVLDEFAFAQQTEKFWNSVYPIVSSDKNSKVLIVSTPNGVGNLFHKLWEKANANGEDNLDGWVPFRVDWWDVPDRDEKWKRQQIASLGNIESFEQEFGNSFNSSCWNKLIADETITKFRQKMAQNNVSGDELSVNSEDVNCKFSYISYHEFDPRNTYIAAGDSSEGTGGDDSVLYIFDITRINNIKMCAKFSRNDVSTTEFAYVIYNICKKYHNPYLAIERNTTGCAVLDALCSTVYSYENVVILNKHGKPGIMSHMQIKQKACLWIRELFAIEDFNIEFYDEKLLNEMDTFVKKDTAQHIVYAALVRKHDDHIMSLIWAMYVLNKEVLEKYYNVLEWVTTSIGKVIPGYIAPLNPYDISEEAFQEMIKDKKENFNLSSPLKLESKPKREKDRFFNDFDGDDEEFINLEEDLHDIMFFRNMIG